MDYVLTLVADRLSAADVAAVARALPDAGTADWLAEGRACDLPFSGLAPQAAEEAARAALNGRTIDLLAQPRAGRRKRLLIADMDSTIITVECIDEMADMLGLKDRVQRITERAMRGEIDFPGALRERAAMLAGLSEAALDEVYRQRVRLTSGARTLVCTMRAAGAVTALVSGGFSFFTERVARDAGFACQRANRLLLETGKLTGTVAEPILDAGGKLAMLRELGARHGLAASETLAVGDGANDVPMLRAAGLGVAFHGKPVVAGAARARITHGDLATILYYQGYRRSEFVTDTAQEG